MQSFIGLEVFVLFKINFAFLSVPNSFPLCHRHAYLLLSFLHITAPFFPVPPPPPASFYPPPKYTLSAFMSYVRMNAWMHSSHMGGCRHRLHMWKAMCNVFLCESHLLYVKWGAQVICRWHFTHLYWLKRSHCAYLLCFPHPFICS